MVLKKSDDDDERRRDLLNQVLQLATQSRHDSVPYQNVLEISVPLAAQSS